MRKCGKNVYAEPYKSVDECTQFLYTPAQSTAKNESPADKSPVIHETFQALLTHFSTRLPHHSNRGEGEGFTSYSHSLLLRLLTI